MAPPEVRRGVHLAAVPDVPGGPSGKMRRKFASRPCEGESEGNFRALISNGERLFDMEMAEVTVGLSLQGFV